MICTIRKIKAKPLVLVFLLYILSSYVCQETLLSPRINSLFLMAFVGLAAVYATVKYSCVDTHFCRWYLLFLMYSLCSASLMRENVFPTLYQMLVVLILTFCFCVVITSKETLELTVFIYILAAVCMGILIISYNPQYLIENIEGLDRVRLGEDETGNANIFSSLMMFSGVFASWQVLYKKNPILRIFSILSLVFILYLMALSGGRKTIIALIACTMFFIWKKSGHSGKKRVLSIVVICSLLYLLVYLTMNVPWLYDVVGNRFEGFFSFISGSDNGQVSSDSTRKKMIEIGFQEWTRRPIFGHGLDSFKFFNRMETGHMYYSHNNYVEMLYDFGLIGFLFYYIFVYKLYKKLVALPEEHKNYSILGIGILIELLVFDMGGVAYYMNGNMIMLCIVSLIAYSPFLFNNR